MLWDCLAAVARQDYDGVVWTVVVNNGHSELDAQSAWASAVRDLGGVDEAARPAVFVDIAGPCRIIPAKDRAIAEALRRTDGQFVGFLDYNSRPDGGWVSELVAAFQTPDRVHPRDTPVGMAGGVVVDREQPELLVSLGHHMSGGGALDLGYRRPIGELGELTTAQAWADARPFAPCLCACLYSRACLETMAARTAGDADSVFTRELGHYYGCVDIGLKAQSAGFAYGFRRKAVCHKERFARDSEKPRWRQVFEASNRLAIARSHYAPGPRRDAVIELAQEQLRSRPDDIAAEAWQRAEQVTDAIAKSLKDLRPVAAELDP